MSSSPASRSLSLQTKLLGALTLGLTVILLCALAGLGSAVGLRRPGVPLDPEQVREVLVLRTACSTPGFILPSESRRERRP